MPLTTLEYAVFFAAAIPFIFYVLAIYSAARYFWRSRNAAATNRDFTPPISNLKPVRGLDPDAYENFASFCRQDYPDYELLFCVTDQTDPSVPVIQKLMQDFPERQIRLLYSAGHTAINDKVAKLRLMEREAQYEYLVINDSDVRVDPGYFRRIIEPLRDSKAWRGDLLLRVGGRRIVYRQTSDDWDDFRFLRRIAGGLAAGWDSFRARADHGVYQAARARALEDFRYWRIARRMICYLAG